MVEILEENDDPRIRVDFVWVQIWSNSTYTAAENLMPISPDPRARVWWDTDHVLSVNMSPHMSNVNPVVDGKPTRVRFEIKKDGSKVRVAARGGKELGVVHGPRK